MRGTVAPALATVGCFALALVAALTLGPQAHEAAAAAGPLGPPGSALGDVILYLARTIYPL